MEKYYKKVYITYSLLYNETKVNYVGIVTGNAGKSQEGHKGLFDSFLF